jgi:hypothetical protein
VSAPVDVLDVPTLIAEMRRQAAQRNATWPCILLKDLVPLLDHVGVLIAADREYDNAIAAAKELNRKVAESGWFEVEFDALRKSGERVVRAKMRREEALDVIGGAA